MDIKYKEKIRIDVLIMDENVRQVLNDKRKFPKREIKNTEFYFVDSRSFINLFTCLIIR